MRNQPDEMHYLNAEVCETCDLELEECECEEPEELFND